MAALAALAACNGFKVDYYVSDISYPFGEGGDTLFASVSLEYPVRGMDEEAMDAVKESISTIAFDMEGMEYSSLEEMAAIYEADLIDEFVTENESSLGKGVLSWEDTMEGYFVEPYKKYRCYVISYYSYRGGPHGISTLTGLVFGPDGTLLTEDALIRDDARADVDALIYRHLVEQDESLADYIDEDYVGANGNFLLRKDGVEWFFQPLEVAPSSLGILSSLVPWAELKPYILVF